MDKLDVSVAGERMQKTIADCVKRINCNQAYGFYSSTCFSSSLQEKLSD